MKHHPGSATGWLTILLAGALLSMAAAYGVLTWAYVEQSNRVDDLVEDARSDDEVLALLADVVTAFAVLTGPDEPPGTIEEARQQLRDFVNAQRAEEGLPPLPPVGMPSDDAGDPPPSTTSTTRPPEGDDEEAAATTTTTTSTVLISIDPPPIDPPAIDVPPVDIPDPLGIAGLAALTAVAGAAVISRRRTA